MISIFFVSNDQKIITKPIFTRLIWETHRKGTAGSLELEVLDQKDTLTTLGTFVHVFLDKERILIYRIYERELQHHYILIKAYDQLYRMIQSKESVRISMANYNEIKDLSSVWDHTQDRDGRDNEIMSREQFHKAYILQGTIREDVQEANRGVFASDVILLFAKRYRLGLDYIDYSDAPNLSTNNVNFYVDIDKYGFPSRVTNREKVLDIIQSYMDLTTILLKDIYVLYDGGFGLCYRRLEDMRTRLMFDLTTIGNYQFREALPMEYANWVDFPITGYQENGGLQTVSGYDDGYYQDWDRIDQFGIFHDIQDITEQELLSDQDEMIHAFGNSVDKTNITYQMNASEIIQDRILFYKSMNEVLPTTLTLKNVMGSWKVRGGSIIGIEVQTFDQKKIRMEVVVESVRHTYISERNHHMDIEITNTFTNTNPFKGNTRNIKTKIPI